MLRMRCRIDLLNWSMIFVGTRARVITILTKNGWTCAGGNMQRIRIKAIMKSFRQCASCLLACTMAHIELVR